MRDTGFIVFAHGSSIETANEAVRVVARQFAEQGGYTDVAAAFLEGGKPDLSGAIGELLEHGLRRFVVLPYFLTLGLHLQRDLPRLVEEALRRYPGIEIEVMPPLDGHPAMIDALLGRAAEAHRTA